MDDMRFEQSVTLPVSAEQAFNWHTLPGAFDRLTPPWQKVEIVRTEGTPPMEGSIVELHVKLGPVWRPWRVIHQNFIPGKQFVDVTLEGPFPKWEHTHRVEAIDTSTSKLTDDVTYRLPMGKLGAMFGKGYATKQFESLFKYRHAVTQNDLAMHAAIEGSPLTVAITGASGLIGSNLSHLLTTGGHRVIKLVRRATQHENEVTWDPNSGIPDTSKLEGIDAVVHLAGENIVGRWTPAKKQAIRDSRVNATRHLCESLAKMSQPPKALISASATGYFGDRGDEVLSEDSEPGGGFLSEVAIEWEDAADPARQAGIRVVHPRIGVVLTPAGGALQRMLPIFLAGLGGKVGSGKQYWPWIALDDLLYAMVFAITTPELSGPVNFVAPQQTTQHELAKTLGKVLRRPTLLPTPSFGPKLLMGELADALLLTSTRAQPSVLLNAGYEFRYPKLDSALRHLLGK